MMNDIEKLCFSIAKSYDEQKAAPLIANLINKIRQGGTYRDLYEFCRMLGIGDKLRNLLTIDDWNISREDYIKIAQNLYDVMKKYNQDINDLAETVQKSLNEQMGISLKPQKIKANDSFINKIIDNAIGENGKIDSLVTSIQDFGIEITDKIIKANAILQAESGFDVVVIRRYDDIGIHNYANYSDKRKKSHMAETCMFCKEREGTWTYEQTKKDSRVYQRHPGCSCSIDFVNKGFSKRVQNYN